MRDDKPNHPSISDSGHNNIPIIFPKNRNKNMHLLHSVFLYTIRYNELYVFREIELATEDI